MSCAKPVPIQNVVMKGGFWEPIRNVVMDKAIPYQWEAINDRIEGAYPNGSYRNFRIAAGLEKGGHFGRVYQDSDLAKWVEAASNRLCVQPDTALEAQIDEIAEVLEKAQDKDGYLQTYFQLKAPDKRWAPLRQFDEMYAVGHWIEAAVAYKNATGKRRLLDVMIRMASLIAEHYGPEEGKLHASGDHEEIELALMRLYEATGEQKFLDLAKYLVDIRGTDQVMFSAPRPGYGEQLFTRLYGSALMQGHLPVRKQKTVEGHAVRALYLCCGMADVARETHDRELMDACRTLFFNAVNRKMYITGGLGSTHVGEAFTGDYDLPSQTAYTETCASIALAMFAQRMLRSEQDSRYADAMEHVLYNTCIAGMAMDGQKYFYVNPIEMDPYTVSRNPDLNHVRAQRLKWFSVPCCPANISRTLMGLASFAYSTSNDSVYIHLYAQSDAVLNVLSQRISLSVKTSYPYEGKVTVTPGEGEYRLCLRKPGWCHRMNVFVNGDDACPINESGYLCLYRKWAAGDVVLIDMDMPARRVYSNPAVADTFGKVCLMRGPVLYCVEEADNGKGLHRVKLSRNAELSAGWSGELGGIGIIRSVGSILTNQEEALYSEQSPGAGVPVQLTFIPYFRWANRGEGEMRIWLNEEH